MRQLSLTAEWLAGAMMSESMGDEVAPSMKISVSAFGSWLEMPEGSPMSPVTLRPPRTGGLMKTAEELRQGLEEWIWRYSGDARGPMLLRLDELLKRTVEEERHRALVTLVEPLRELEPVP